MADSGWWDPYIARARQERAATQGWQDRKSELLTALFEITLRVLLTIKIAAGERIVLIAELPRAETVDRRPGRGGGRPEHAHRLLRASVDVVFICTRQVTAAAFACVSAAE